MPADLSSIEAQIRTRLAEVRGMLASLEHEAAVLQDVMAALDGPANPGKTRTAAPTLAPPVAPAAAPAAAPISVPTAVPAAAAPTVAPAARLRAREAPGPIPPARAASVGSQDAGRGGSTVAARVLVEITAQPGVTASQLAGSTGVTRQHIYRVLAPLQERGEVSKDGRGYHLRAKAPGAPAGAPPSSSAAAGAAPAKPAALPVATETEPREQEPGSAPPQPPPVRAEVTPVGPGELARAGVPASGPRPVERARAGGTLWLERDRGRDSWYELRAGEEVVGRLGWDGRASTPAAAERGSDVWHLRRVGTLRRRVMVVDAASGEETARGHPHGLFRRAWTLSLAGEEFDLRVEGSGNRTWALRDGGDRVLVMRLHEGDRPIEIGLERPTSSGVLLACCYLALLSRRSVSDAKPAAEPRAHMRAISRVSRSERTRDA